MKIAILYICTGKYNIFWKEFYDSFMSNFCTEISKDFFVFTDDLKLNYSENNNVNVIYQKALEWPYPTLMRYNMFCRIKEELKKYDYIFFFNSNMVCNMKVTSGEILPKEELNENLVMVIHPGFEGKKSRFYPYERNSKSKAFIPYNEGKYYVQGSLNGGTSKEYVKLIETINMNTNIDLENKIIAKVHDESHLNRYILNRKDVKFISPAFSNPEDMNLKYEKKIILLDKRNYFDVGNFKKIKEKNIVKRVNQKAIKIAQSEFGYLRDSILRKHV